MWIGIETRRTANGFTLIEIIVFVAIVAVLLGLIITKSKPAAPGSPGATPVPTRSVTQDQISACSGKLPAASCTYKGNDGTTIYGICRLVEGNTVACTPQ